jgi:hypothetical protein
MKTAITLVAFAIVYWMSSSTHAQQAPHVCGAGPGANEIMAGVQPAGPGRAPTPLCYWKSEGGQQVVTPTVRWADRWGAMAAGKGFPVIYGIVADLPDKRAANEAALLECKRRGGVRCEVALSYHNHCAVVSTGLGSSFANSAATVEQATEDSMRRCEAANGKGACWVYYSGCSLPVQVQ